MRPIAHERGVPPCRVPTDFGAGERVIEGRRQAGRERRTQVLVEREMGRKKGEGESVGERTWRKQ